VDNIWRFVVRRSEPRVNPPQPLDDEGSPTEEAKKIFAEVWMQQKHPMLGGRSPQECINNGDE
jgi:hypothetical protein